MHKWKIVVSSVTGNTRKIADAMAEAVGTSAVDLKDTLPEAEGADIVAVGFWLWRGGPDPKTAEFLSKLHDTNVVLFATHAADAKSEHAVTALVRAAYNVGPDCNIIATFSCQGQVSEAVLARRAKLPKDDPHTKSKGWITSKGHPNADDLHEAAEFAKKADHKLELLEKFIEKKGQA
ncbi:MAG: flavodoxin family protein [Schwartzia sp.]|nr:flavodoxin family protein [Schwartzia sp. (in: firmicutes)]